MVNIKILDTREKMGKIAAAKAASIFKKELARGRKVKFVAATGASQFKFLEVLCKHNEIAWDQTVMFHLDEYIGISESHPASFRKYLTERLVKKVHPGEVHFIRGDAPDPHQECTRLNNLIKKIEIDVAFIGIGENGHIAFNDPPADFETEEPYIIVELTEKCRRQQIGEGWFPSLKEVPKKAISMSVQEILRAKHIICVCPDKRKADAVKNCLSKGAKIDPKYPASILKTHPRVFCYLDKASASLLNSKT